MGVEAGVLISDPALTDFGSFGTAAVPSGSPGPSSTSPA